MDANILMQILQKFRGNQPGQPMGQTPPMDPGAGAPSPMAADPQQAAMQQLSQDPNGAMNPIVKQLLLKMGLIKMVDDQKNQTQSGIDQVMQ